MRPYRALLALAIVGCGGTQARPDGGPGAGGTGGTAVDAMVPPALQAQLDAAKATWTAAKSDCAVYSYDRLHDKGIGATGPWTDVEIRNDLPTRRRFSAEVLVDGGFFAWMFLWDEMGSQVGEHTGDAGVFPASTVEQLLAECATVLAGDPVANILTLTIDARGVPTTCHSRPVGCADSCQVGITIQDFVCAPLSGDAGAM